MQPFIADTPRAALPNGRTHTRRRWPSGAARRPPTAAPLAERPHRRSELFAVPLGQHPRVSPSE